MPLAQLSADALAALEAALGDRGVIERYHAKIHPQRVAGCLWWVGAISSKGHGRFWVGADPARPGAGFVVIAHRFGYAIEHGLQALVDAPVLAHAVCDNPMCQDPAHLRPSTVAENTQDWAVRRHRLAGPLRDRRGARARAERARQALREGRDPLEALSTGIPMVERDQLPCGDPPGGRVPDTGLTLPPIISGEAPRSTCVVAIDPVPKPGRWVEQWPWRSRPDAANHSPAGRPRARRSGQRVWAP